MLFRKVECFLKENVKRNGNMTSSYRWNLRLKPVEGGRKSCLPSLGYKGWGRQDEWLSFGWWNPQITPCSSQFYSLEINCVLGCICEQLLGFRDCLSQALAPRSLLRLRTREKWRSPSLAQWLHLKFAPGSVLMLILFSDCLLQAVILPCITSHNFHICELGAISNIPISALHYRWGHWDLEMLSNVPESSS